MDKKTLVPNTPTTTRDRRDQCPGVARPWPASDGLLVRLRLIGGRVATRTLLTLAEIAGHHGDGSVHVTSRANLQLRGFPGTTGGRLTAPARAAVAATGLLPTETHELVRNVMVSPQTGLAGGRIDLTPVADELDELICARPELAGLPGKFLFVLDDGRGDLIKRWCDLGLAALDADNVQLRVGRSWGPVVATHHAAPQLTDLAARFATRRGTGADAPWHVAELDPPLASPVAADLHLPDPAPWLPYGTVPGGRHIQVPATGLDHKTIADLTTKAHEVIITPWRGVLVPERKHD